LGLLPQLQASELVAFALESAAALLVPQLEDQRIALEAVVSLVEHVQQQQGGVMERGPLKCDAVIDFMGWNSSEGQFGSVAKGRLLSESSREQVVPGSGSNGKDKASSTSAGKNEHHRSGSRLANVISEGALLVEVGQVKLGAIMCGLEAACMLLRIDGCIKDVRG